MQAPFSPDTVFRQSNRISSGSTIRKDGSLHRNSGSHRWQSAVADRYSQSARWYSCFGRVVQLDRADGTNSPLFTCGVTDLRKSYTGLAAIIKLKFHLDPYSRCMFAFCNRRRTLIKILQWDGSGFWILMKRLDRNSFHWPDTPDELRKVTLKEIHWLCDGLSLNPSGAFEERHPKIVV